MGSSEFFTSPLPESSKLAKALASGLDQGLGRSPSLRTDLPGRHLSSNLSS